MRQHVQIKIIRDHLHKSSLQHNTYGYACIRNVIILCITHGTYWNTKLEAIVFFITLPHKKGEGVKTGGGGGKEAKVKDTFLADSLRS